MDEFEPKKKKNDSSENGDNNNNGNTRKLRIAETAIAFAAIVIGFYYLWQIFAPVGRDEREIGVTPLVSFDSLPSGEFSITRSFNRSVTFCVGVCPTPTPTAADYLAQGKAAHDAGEYDRAIALFDRALAFAITERTREITAETYYYRGLSHLLVNDYSAALDDFTSALEYEYANSQEVFAGLADTYEALGQLDKAQEYREWMQ